MRSVSYFEYAKKCWFNPVNNFEEKIDLETEECQDLFYKTKSKSKNKNLLISLISTISIVASILFKKLNFAKENNTFYELD